MTPQRAGKRVSRAIRSIPVDAITPEIAATESNGRGLWCLVGGAVSYIRADGGEITIDWDDELQYAQFARWLAARPERVHDTHAAAIAFVRSRLGTGAPGSPPAGDP